jgi:hypothetical protein
MTIGKLGKGAILGSDRALRISVVFRLVGVSLRRGRKPPRDPRLKRVLGRKRGARRRLRMTLL